MLITILQYTPTWVFVVLFGLIALGFTQSFPRSLTLRRSAVLPLVLVGLSLMGVISTFGGQPLALLLWVSGLTASVATLHGRLDTSDVRSGIFLARAMALWALARRALLNAAHHPQP